MPKNRKVEKNKEGVVKMSIPKSKLRIGNRKSGRSAFLMSTEELKNVLAKDDYKKYHQKARTVLRQRGVTV